MYPFEIQVFEYEPLPLGAFTYESHINYVLDGTTKFDGSVAPEQGQFHASSEWTAGPTDQIRFGAVVLSAVVPASVRNTPDSGSCRIFMRQSLGVFPLNLGFVAEFSFERPLFDADTQQVELCAIVEKHIGRLQIDGNIVLARALHGPGTEIGWGVEPSARISWQQWRTLTPSVEYYSALGPLGNLSPLANQAHLVFPGADWKIGERVAWSFGVGLGTTGGAHDLLLTSRLEYEFSRKHD